MFINNCFTTHRASAAPRRNATEPSLPTTRRSAWGGPGWTGLAMETTGKMVI